MADQADNGSNSMNQSMDLFDSLDENEPTLDTPDAQTQNEVDFENRSTSVDTVQVYCPFCNTSKPDEYSMQEHILLEHQEDGFSDVASPSKSNSEPHSNFFTINNNTFVCPYCEAVHDTKEQLANHLILVHEDIDHEELTELIRSLDLLLCPMCLFVSSTSSDIQQHIDVNHSDGNELSTNRSEAGPGGAYGGGTTEDITCPVCGMPETDPDLLRSHIELHFESSIDHDTARPSSSKQVASKTSIASSSSSLSNSSNTTRSSTSSSSSSGKGRGRGKRGGGGGGGSRYNQQYKQNLERAVLKGKISPGDYHEQMAKLKENNVNGMDDGHSRVEGMVEKLQSFYQNRSGKDQRVVLCHPTDYFCGSYGDKGWGCGYRNFQMMLSSLVRIPLYSRKLSAGGHTTIPSIPKVQEMIETAWRKGFDREGCLQLEGKVANTRKWIGATEIVATLSSLGIKCELVDFPRCSAPDGTHPHLVQWVQDYFHRHDNAKPPLYLQHQGHSRTIIGVEMDKGVTRLLLFDPGSSLEQIASLKSGLQNWKQMSTFRRNLAAFKAKQYQIVSVVGILNGEEYERSKRLTSTRVM